MRVCLLSLGEVGVKIGFTFSCGFFFCYFCGKGASAAVGDWSFELRGVQKNLNQRHVFRVPTVECGWWLRGNCFLFRMKVDVSLLVILGIFAVVGIKIGFTISQTQQESAPNDALDAVSFGPTSGDLLAHKLREAKTMFEEDLLSEHEFRLYRQQLLGLSGEMLERLAEEKDDDDEGPAETAEAAETDSGPDETTTDSLKPAENNDDRQSAPNVDVGELPPLPEVPSEMIRQRFDANERSGKLKELLADKLKAWKENVPSQKPAEGRVEGEREVAQRDNFVLNERPVEDEELLKAAKLAEALKPSLLPKKLFVGGEAGKYDFAGQSISQPDPNYPSIKGAAYSPDKHRWQGGSLLVSSCPDREATHKFIFTKTHKTGSSTITNLFHRFGYKYGPSTRRWPFLLLLHPFIDSTAISIFVCVRVSIHRFCIYCVTRRIEHGTSKRQHVLRLANPRKGISHFH